MQTVLVEVPQDDGPWGARGIGEHPMIPSIAALANAIARACGARLKNPPFSAEKIYFILQEKKISTDWIIIQSVLAYLFDRVDFYNFL